MCMLHMVLYICRACKRVMPPLRIMARTRISLIEALDQENPSRRSLGRVVLFRWYIRYLCLIYMYSVSGGMALLLLCVVLPSDVLDMYYGCCTLNTAVRILAARVTPRPIFSDAP